MKRVITYGTFDLLHYGHINLLRRARQMGDYLIVGLSTDEFNWNEKQKKCYFSYEKRKQLLEAIRYVDLVIPRGSKSLIDFVRQNAKVPVIETGAGVCHTYFDRSGDIEKGRAIVFNAKTRRVSVCNALDCLIMHRSRLSDLPDLCAPLAEKNVVLYADDFAYAILCKLPKSELF